MRKVIALLLALSVVFALVGCSSTPAEETTNTVEPTETTQTNEKETEENILSYDAMLEKAERIELSNIYAEADENELRAEQEYVGNSYRVSAYVAEIGKDNFSTPNFINYGYHSVINLANKEDLMSLSKDNTYEIIGVISSIDNGTIMFDNAYLIDADNYDFVLDGLYYSATGSIDPSKYDITVEEYFERNPQMLEENLSEEDEIDLLVFATLNASDENGADLYLPNTESNGELALELKIGNNSYNTTFNVNDIDDRMSKFFDGYKDGYYPTNDLLKAGSGDSAEIAGLFFVEYGVYREAVENNTEITLNWGGRYTITLNAQDIIKIDSVSAIAEILNK